MEQKKKSGLLKQFSSGKTLIGFIVCLVVFCLGFVIHGNVGLFFNLAGFLVVFGGTFGATLICYKMERLSIVLKVLITSYKKPLKTPDEIIEILVDLSVKSKLQGLLSLQEDEEETTVLFLERALSCLVDGYSKQQIRDVLNTEMYFFKLRRAETERVLTTMAEISPSFGLVGSVVGLIAMLAGVGDTAVILSTVPIALTSTLYGIVLANFFFLPFSVRIKERTNKELLLQKIILEGVLAIESEHHPRVLERKLKSFLTPSSRNGQLVSFKRIQEKFKPKIDAEKEEAEEEKKTPRPKTTRTQILPARKKA
ncbi:MAG: MotA/TolQ/ExbB proton channel family protein [Proteobacteria bacterium]|nr:MotA/TolQ/ExbB proton channel family protein [Pseudomonadota bacterium]